VPLSIQPAIPDQAEKSVSYRQSLDRVSLLAVDKKKTTGTSILDTEALPMAQMSHAEQMDIITKALAAAQDGDYEKEVSLARKFPLSPHLAKAARDIFGVKYLEGWDLSEAEATYGKDWLERKNIR